jgi:hypothetical protein
MELDNPIIGVVGRAGAGKDTVCNMAVSLLYERRIDALRIACADPLKEICIHVFGTAFDLPPSCFTGSQVEKNAPLNNVSGWTGRKILQHIGTEGFRYVQPTVWSRLMYARAEKLLAEQQVDAVFVSDIRMPEEAQIIQNNGGIIVRVVRPSNEITNQGLPGHSSELQQASIREDFVINNEDRSLDELRVLVRSLLVELHFIGE